MLGLDLGYASKEVAVHSVELAFPGQNDASIIFKAVPGGRRWQHAESVVEAQQLNYGRNYTMIVGSHRNSCFKIERNGQQMLQVRLAEAVCQHISWLAGTEAASNCPQASQAWLNHSALGANLSIMTVVIHSGFIAPLCAGQG